VSASGLPHPLSDDLVDLLSERTALLGDATRIRIPNELRGGERNVQAVADALATTQQHVSGHLRFLHAAGAGLMPGPGAVLRAGRLHRRPDGRGYGP